jgi:hypothetical protein
MFLERGFAFEVFEVISDFYHLTGNFFEFFSDPENDLDKFIPNIEWLERNGFVVTTETENDLIQVKPLGFEYYRSDEEEIIGLFCLHGKEYA